VVIGLIIGLLITADQQRPEQTGGRRCETIRTGENDNPREKMQNVRGDSSAEDSASGSKFSFEATSGFTFVAARSLAHHP
jgi:hypothetical protein